MSELKSIIENYICDAVVQAKTETKYRKPLIAYADASDKLFAELKNLVNPGHLLPEELLQNPQTVIVFFLPFAEEIVRANRKGEEPDRKWAVAYHETNILLYQLSKGLSELLGRYDYKCGFVEPTNNFDKVALQSQWSHKHVAYISGLGKFGLNRQLITPVGCAGRMSSVVTDAKITPDKRLLGDHMHEMCAKCGWCQRGACPVKALEKDKWDKHLCWQRLLANGEKFPELDRAHCCGKCVVGPCAIL